MQMTIKNSQNIITKSCYSFSLCWPENKKNAPNLRASRRTREPSGRSILASAPAAVATGLFFARQRVLRFRARRPYSPAHRGASNGTA